MSPPKIVRREATELTRRQIVRVARVAFADHGLTSTSLQDIADGAGISRPGLLKHFPSKSAVFDAVATSFTKEAFQVAGPRTSLREAAAQWATTVPDYARLCTALLHEAMTERSPRRQTLAEHHENVLHGWAHRDALAPLAARVPPAFRASVLTATWEGLQVMQQYLGAADPAIIWESRGHAAPAQVPPAVTMVEAVRLESVLSDDPGYASGRRRRDAIVADAAALFSQFGYHGTTMREIADRVSVSPSALLYHFPDKAALLAEVLRRRDVQMVERRGDEILDPVVELESIGKEARRDELAEHGLISLYSVLSTEAATGSHPAREYFRHRFERTVAYFENVIARATGVLGLTLNPRRESLLLVALWDGLQYQSLLANESPIDVPQTLDAYVEGLLHPR